MKQRTKSGIIVLMLCLIVCAFCGAASQTSVSSSQDTEKTYTRLECLNKIMTVVGFDETDAKLMKNTHYYNGFPLLDIQPSRVDQAYVGYAYDYHIAYGILVSPEQAQQLEEDYNRKAAIAREKFLKERGISSLEELNPYTSFGDLTLDKNGDLVPDGINSIHVPSGYYFDPDRTATIGECVGFMTRCLKDDKSFIDLDITWQYAKEIGLVLETDAFSETPETTLTQSVLDRLTERFTSCTSERIFKHHYKVIGHSPNFYFLGEEAQE